MFMFSRKLKKDHALYIKMNSERFLLEEDDAKRAEADSKIEEIDHFVENIYAKDVFDKYVKKRPKLISNRTDCVVSWEEAFGSVFDEIPKGVRHSLVGLVEGGGLYRLK